MQRMEMELERTRHELERAKMAADKADSTRQLHVEQTEKLHREIENWKDKCNKAQIDVTEAEIRYSKYPNFGRPSTGILVSVNQMVQPMEYQTQGFGFGIVKIKIGFLEQNK